MSPAGAQAVDAAEQESVFEGGQTPDGGQRSRRLLRAVEQYKAACMARGAEPAEEEHWLVLLAALSAEDLLPEA